MKSKNISYISVLQIIGPIFVILGHSLNGLECDGWWYTFTKEWIYIFHMPLFFMISGYLLAYKGYLRNASYSSFIYVKVKRLLIPYIVWNLAFCVPKFLAQQYISDVASLNILDMLKAFVVPRQNIWGHTWFLLGLFLVFLLAPIFKKILGRKNIAAATLAVCCVLYVLPIGTEFLALSDLHKDLLFFVIGCLLGQIQYDKFIYHMKRLRIVFLVGAIASSLIALLWYEPTKMLHFIPCGFILFSFLSASALVKELPSMWEKIASYSFGIYIMHWPVMIIVRVLLHQILGVNVFLTAMTMCILGYIVPILIVVIMRVLPLGKLKKPLKYLLGV